MNSETISEQEIRWLDLFPEAVALFNAAGLISHSNTAFKLFLDNQGLQSTSGLSCEAFENHLHSLAQPESQLVKTDYIARSTVSNKCLIVLDKPSGCVIQKTVRFSEENDLIAGMIHLSDITKNYRIDRSKTEFLCTTAHELRAPMANIFGYTELLKNNLYPEEDQQKMLDIVYQETARMLNILNDLLDLAKIEAQDGSSLELELQDFETLLTTVLNAQKQMLSQHTVNLSSMMTESVQCDRAKIEQVLINVLSNACKFSETGSTIQIHIAPATCHDAPGVQIDIRDEGCGISANQLPHIFNRFYRGQSTQKTQGTGLGMSIAKEIMNLHQGTITISSTVGKGTQVSLWLPLLQR